MSTLHGQKTEAKMARGELRKPESRADQPGQRAPPDDDNERDTSRDHKPERRAEPRRGDKAP